MKIYFKMTEKKKNSTQYLENQIFFSRNFLCKDLKKKTIAFCL